MSNITTELANFRIDMGIDINQLPDTVWLRYYNDSRDLFIDRIIKEKEDYFYNYFTWTFVIWQNEYTLAKRWDLSNDPVPVVLDWIFKIKWVVAKFSSTDTEFTKLTSKTIENLEKDITSYSNTTNPFYCLMDNSVFIYPTPTATTNYKIHCITYPKKLALSDTDTLPDQYTKIIMYWVKKRWFESQMKENESQLAKNEFEDWIYKSCIALSGRINEPTERTLPYLGYLYK